MGKTTVTIESDYVTEIDIDSVAMIVYYNINDIDGFSVVDYDYNTHNVSFMATPEYEIAERIKEHVINKFNS